MSNPLAFDPAHSAVLCMDYQSAFVSIYAGAQQDELLARAENVLINARRNGIATSGVVLSTLLQAGDADYRLIVIKDACADLDQELHACLMEKLFVKHATVVTADEFVDACGPVQSSTR